MNNTLIFLRHAETKKEKSIPVSDWVLTEDGLNKTNEMAKTGIFDDINIFISSSETKAIQTIIPFAERVNKQVIKIHDLHELDRDSGELMTKEQYDDMKVKIFQDLDFTSFGWETCNHALNRFKLAVEDVEKKYDNQKILISAHGTVMTLYFASLQNKLNDLMQRWKNLGFLDYGIIKDGKIIKDIA